MEYNSRDFVDTDPIQIPHSYKTKQDIELTAFWTAILAWGQRKTIINKALELFGLMGDSPYEFIISHKAIDRKRFQDFKHRTFNYTDTLYFLEFFQHYYREHESLESAFTTAGDMKAKLIAFHDLFFSLEYPPRTRKHIATPARKSSCKRINMFLRWMVRPGDTGVDFGLWHNLDTSDLMMPLDVHVARVASRLGLLTRKQRDWKAVEELTQNLRELDPHDPAKYDFALFGLGVSGEL